MTRALVLHGVTTGSSSQRTRAATAGPDVVVTNVPARFLPELTAREHDPGVTGHSGPYPVASAVMRAGRHAAAVIAEGRDQAPAPAGQPKVTQGTWVRPGDVVLERDFADAPGIGAGASVTLNGRPFQVAGVAVTAAFPPYPETGFMPHPTRASPELIWLTQAGAPQPCHHRTATVVGSAGEERPGSGRLRGNHTNAISQAGALFAMKDTPWDHGLRVTADADGLAGHAGAVLLHKLADRVG